MPLTYSPIQLPGIHQHPSMKGYLLLPLLALAMWLPAQNNYLPLPTSDATWSDYKYWTRTGAEAFTFFTRQISPAGDTVIKDTVYTRLVATSPSAPPEQPLAEDEQYIGALYQDDSLVYFQPPGDEPRRLLYDFSLQVGDTLACQGDLPCPTMQLNAIDTITLTDEAPRRRYQVLVTLGPLDEAGENVDTFYWIEGIGSTLGLLVDPQELFYHFLTIDPQPQWELLCFQSGGELLYTGPSFTGTCDLLVLDTRDQLLPLELELGPNPTSGLFTLRLQATVSEPLHFYVTDMTGLPVCRGQLQPTEHTIDLSRFPPGLYGLVVADERRQLVRRVLVMR